MATKHGIRRQRRVAPAPGEPHRRQIQLSDEAHRTLYFLIGASISLSAWAPLRVTVLGFLAHPYMVPMGVLFVTSGLRAFSRVPVRILAAGAWFIAAYMLVDLPGGFDPELVKLGVMFVSAAMLAGSARSRDDVVAAMVGMVIAMGAISAVTMATFTGNTLEGVNPLGGIATRTANSLYALPALLFGGHLLLDNLVSVRVRTLLLLSTATIVVTIFSSGNRSGYLGVIVIAVLLLSRGRRPRDVVLLFAAGAFTYWGYLRFGNMDLFSHRLERTVDGTPDFRANILRECFRIGLDNIFLGVTPQNLDHEIGRRLQTDDISPHNLLALVWAGGGLVLTTALLAVLAALWRAPAALMPRGDSEANRAGVLLHSAILIFLVRSQFSQEALTTPGFPLAIGLALALVMAYAPATRGDSGGRGGRRNRGTTLRHPDLFAEARRSAANVASRHRS